MSKNPFEVFADSEKFLVKAMKVMREMGAAHYSITLRDSDEQPIAGVFYVDDVELCELLKSAIEEWDQAQEEDSK